MHQLLVRLTLENFNSNANSSDQSHPSILDALTSSTTHARSFTFIFLHITFTSFRSYALNMLVFSHLCCKKSYKCRSGTCIKLKPTTITTHKQVQKIPPRLLLVYHGICRTHFHFVDQHHFGTAHKHNLLPHFFHLHISHLSLNLFL